MSHHQIQCWWTLVPPCTLLYIVYMYVLFLLCLLLYKCTKFLETQLSSPLFDPKRGPERSLFFIPALRGLLHLRLGQELLYVHIVHSTWRPNGCSPSSSQKRGPERSLFFLSSPAGLSTSRLGQEQERIDVFYLWTQGPPVNL